MADVSAIGLERYPVTLSTLSFGPVLDYPQYGYYDLLDGLLVRSLVWREALALFSFIGGGDVDLGVDFNLDSRKHGCFCRSGCLPETNEAAV